MVVVVSVYKYFIKVILKARGILVFLQSFKYGYYQTGHYYRETKDICNAAFYEVRTIATIPMFFKITITFKGVEGL